MEDDIYFVVRHSVGAGAPLHVWYSPFYAAKLQAPLTSEVAGSDVTEVVLLREGEPPGEEAPVRPAAADSRSVCGAAELPCPLCARRPAGEAALATHLLRRHRPELARPTGQARCAVCGAHCADGPALLTHLSSHRPAHRCPHCDKVFSRRQTLTGHACPGPRRAGQGWLCPRCGRLFTTAAAWQRHQRRHTGALRCPGCGRHFASATTRSAHVCRAAASGPRPHRCPHCARRFSSRAGLRQHAALHSDRFACPRCARRFSGGAAARRHEALCGAGEQLALTGAVDCRRCQARFDSLPALAEHARQHELPHLCSTCGRRFRARLQLSAHVCSRIEPARAAETRSPKTPRSAICESCGQTFASRKSLWLHRLAHAERQFACEMCGAKFKRKDTLQAHMATHGQPKVPCPHCGKRFKSNKSLTVHLRLHTGDARFSCDLCGRRFVQKVNMERHRRTHAPDHRLVHRCPACGKCLSSAHHLKEHQLQHSQSRSHHCAACSRSFPRRRDLQRHLSAAHGSGLYRCPFCQMTTRLRSSISRHLAKLHPSERRQWSSAGFLTSLYSPGEQSSAAPELPLTLAPDSALLLTLPPGETSAQPSPAQPVTAQLSPVQPSTAQPPTEAAMGDAQAGDGVLLYVIDVPEMEITFDPPPVGDIVVTQK